MATLYFVKDGPSPDRSGKGYEIPASIIKEKYSDFQIKWLGKNPPVFEKEKPSSSPSRVVFEIKEKEKEFFKVGFYVLPDISPERASQDLDPFLGNKKQ